MIIPAGSIAQRTDRLAAKYGAPGRGGLSRLGDVRPYDWREPLVEEFLARPNEPPALRRAHAWAASWLSCDPIIDPDEYLVGLPHAAYRGQSPDARRPRKHHLIRFRVEDATSWP